VERNLGKKYWRDDIMGRTKKVKSTGRFGARYGAGVRKRVLAVELRKKKKYICPACNKRALKWKAVGIWVCESCGLQLAGGAWDPISDTGMRLLMTIRRVTSSQ